MSDASRPGYQAQKAVAEYAALYSSDETSAKKAIAEAIAEVRRAIDDPNAIMNMALNMMTDPASW